MKRPRDRQRQRSGGGTRVGPLATEKRRRVGCWRDRPPSGRRCLGERRPDAARTPRLATCVRPRGRREDTGKGRPLPVARRQEDGQCHPPVRPLQGREDDGACSGGVAPGYFMSALRAGEGDGREDTTRRRLAWCHPDRECGHPPHRRKPGPFGVPDRHHRVRPRPVVLPRSRTGRQRRGVEGGCGRGPLLDAVDAGGVDELGIARQRSDRLNVRVDCQHRRRRITEFRQRTVVRPSHPQGTRSRPTPR